MREPVVIIGIGEMAGVFARGFLRCGHPVFPVTRDTDIAEAAEQIPSPELVLVAVAEGDLHATLDSIPSQWHDRIALLQNELLPKDWQAYSFVDPTVISVWFEKKKGQDAKVIMASPAYGPKAAIIKTALESIDIACRELDNTDELLFELVRKNVYILTTNIAGLETGGTVSELWKNHQAIAKDIAEDVMDIQQWLVKQALPRARLIEGMVEAFEGDPNHQCMGRSATARLKRALALADEAKLDVATLRQIAEKHLQPSEPSIKNIA
jgi:hypothetical protein